MKIVAKKTKWRTKTNPDGSYYVASRAGHGDCSFYVIMEDSDTGELICEIPINPTGKPNASEVNTTPKI